MHGNQNYSILIEMRNVRKKKGTSLINYKILYLFFFFLEININHLKSKMERKETHP